MRGRWVVRAPDWRIRGSDDDVMPGTIMRSFGSLLNFLVDCFGAFNSEECPSKAVLIRFVPAHLNRNFTHAVRSVVDDPEWGPEDTVKPLIHNPAKHIKKHSGCVEVHYRNPPTPMDAHITVMTDLFIFLRDHPPCNYDVVVHFGRVMQVTDYIARMERTCKELVDIYAFQQRDELRGVIQKFVPATNGNDFLRDEVRCEMVLRIAAIHRTIGAPFGARNVKQLRALCVDKTKTRTAIFLKVVERCIEWVMQENREECGGFNYESDDDYYGHSPNEDDLFLLSLGSFIK